ncbi:hydrogenase 3 maturation peptidase HycL [Malaciobacter marinus]|jgi:hydrogenase 3 maturation protease|uniref:Hydrogenase 3 maturation peptidase HycL n=1 Tax=Malaciobacter marinus TaxID=505249 RepID=A0AB36ZU41_9BACT|nr:hydrogenase 3 maturation endopeptidase HyCI [Malaciobacter marinus]PPK58827.1 hydrogenase 3 maturation peptidase HycL [Malaciobacter marinus]SKB39804.1 Hydrogenase 3 maturation peptidase Hycl. Aspartic peptidase. MEROPS family A31 [Malaciobacter marinus]
MKKAILTIGNTLRGDDGVTAYLGSLIEKDDSLDWQIFYGEDTPESEFHKIREYAPDLIIVADAMTGMKVGSVEVMDLSDDRDYMYSTHNLPTPILISYLKGFCQRVLFLGLTVDIENVLEVNEEVSKEAKQTAKSAFKKVKEIDSIFDDNN